MSYVSHIRRYVEIKIFIISHTAQTEIKSKFEQSGHIDLSHMLIRPVTILSAGDGYAGHEYDRKSETNAIL